TVKAFSFGYELTHKLSPVMEDIEGVNAEKALSELLRYTQWTIGEIDATFKDVYRQLEYRRDANVLDEVLQVGKTFNGVLVWDTDKREVSLKDFNNVGRFRGLTVNYGRLLRSIGRNRTTDEMVTRLHVRGSEGLGINSVN